MHKWEGERSEHVEGVSIVTKLWQYIYDRIVLYCYHHTLLM